jgi:hypothetical protein
MFAETSGYPFGDPETRARAGGYDVESWEAGFVKGATDALRLAGRALAEIPSTDVDHLAAVEHLSDYYQRAGSDG